MSALRDSRIGRIIRGRGGIRPLIQAESGNGTKLDNVLRMADWRNRFARLPLEQTLGTGYVAIPRCRALVPII